MNQETNSRAQGTQQQKAVSNQRSSRAGRNRPVLASSTSTDQVTKDQSVVETSDATLPVEEEAPTTNVEDARPRRLPRFFPSLGKDTKEQTVEADPRAARIARATRGTGGSSASSRKVEDSKATGSRSGPGNVSTTRTTTRAASTSATQRPGGFKMRYILGMLLYLLIAEVLGGFEKNLLVSNHLDNLLFQLGPLAVTTSTVLFLLTLLIVLVILARLDLVPRNLGTLMGQPSTRGGRSGQSQNTSDSEAIKGSQPTLKQGVKGDDDDLYQEYREQQRYLQRRERKR
jgi:hypothetical protein